MLSSPVLSVFLVLAFVASATIALPTVSSNIVEVISIHDVSKLKELPQGATLIPLSKAKNGKAVGITYTLGQRQSGDQLVAQGSDSITYPEATNIQLQVEYPSAGTGAVITHVQIDVVQDSDIGQAYLLSGGIGQRSIVLVVEAYNTASFSYSVDLYGIP